MKSNMTIIDKKKVTDFNHLNLFKVKYLDRKGTDKSWIYASRSGKDLIESESGKDSIQSENRDRSLPDAVVVVPFHVNKEKLVLIREFRVPLGDYQYGFPAGLMDKGETIEDTASRELREETGLDLLRVVRISPPIYSSSGMTDESVSLVFSFCMGTPSVKWNEDSEDIEVIMVSQKEAQKLVNAPDLKFDVKSWIVLSNFAQTGLL
ncbi:putative nucleotide diphosphate hydrolase (MutT family hydrolase) [Desulfamplus magnetovallimortis]|uniref:Putative nucleotide diphosphate hydrolase (MutT family hydrolase) n=1 Tax=Desulfamplus magnetovallimortis TaxID=1246637 RepID=A0A1W1HGK8_9BACT|nr:NUDIX hydrolase [Desulfamplus magnetovallimortis]SLM31619.1 putative nucleotide diphosphate hydrolase (MutT family hydrolase) [Desulfamplus magnetovallimortis]